MDRTLNVIERGYQLAKSGQCVDIREIQSQLNQEGYESVSAHLPGSSIKRELHALMKAARETSVRTG